MTDQQSAGSFWLRSQRCRLALRFSQNFSSLFSIRNRADSATIPSLRQCSNVVHHQKLATMSRIGYFLIFFFSTSLFAQGQFADSLKKQLLRDWTRSKEYTLEYLKTMPADKYAYKPQDSIRSFAQQMIHMAQGTVSLMEAATGNKIPSIINRQNLENISSATSKDSVIYFITLSYDYAIEALQHFEMSNSYEHVIRGTFDVTRLGWMFKAFEHQAHHRGQTTIYLRSLGIKPPNERLFDN